MVHGYSGKFVVVDGLDGIGKGVVLNAIISSLEKEGKKVFDLKRFWDAYHVHPDFINKDMPGNFHYPLDGTDVLVSAEPTFVGVGLAIREEMIAKNKRDYSARATAEAYSLDRLILYKRVVLPALEAGKTVIQSRSVSTSLVYQPLQSTTQGEKALTIEDIMELEGNKFALDHAPDLLIIPTIGDVNEVMERLRKRTEKEDNALFENLEFQAGLKPLYEGEDLRKIFESRGTKVKYLDAGISEKETARQAVEIYRGNI